MIQRGLAAFFFKACSPVGSLTMELFAGLGTTAVVARLGRFASGLGIHRTFISAVQRIRLDESDDISVLMNQLADC